MNEFTVADPIVFLCGRKHHHDLVFLENLAEYLSEQAIRFKIIELSEKPTRPELHECLEAERSAVVGFNSLLDHSWIDSQSFMELAHRRNVTIVQWLLDHPAVSWHEFERSDFSNSAFLLNSDQAQAYFQRYCMPEAITSVMGGVGPSRHSRASIMDVENFRDRPINCLISLGCACPERSIDQTLALIGALDAPLREAVNNAVSAGRYDLEQPLEMHLEDALGRAGLHVAHDEFNHCFQLVEQSVQAIRRSRIFKIARDFPVLIQSHISAASYASGGAAEFETGISMRCTLDRMRRSKAVVCISPFVDMIPDGAMNALNAGCVAIVEDNKANRAQLQHGHTALFFRYDDDSLEQGLKIVCRDAERSYEIAAEGFAMRDYPAFRFGQFYNLMRTIRRQSFALS